MDIKTFWSMIDQARNQAGNWNQMAEPLIDLLSDLEIAEIMIWQQIFMEYQRVSYKEKLWAAAYVMNDGCSDDGFDYFRAWLTAQGKEIFMKALQDPDSLAAAGVCKGVATYEKMLGVASKAYFKKLSLSSNYGGIYEMLVQYPLSETMKSEITKDILYADDIDCEWDDNEMLYQLLPRLCKAFGW